MDSTNNPKILAYINDICAQIKDREVHQDIKLELKAHLQEIIDDYLSGGLTENEAVSKAIAQMGNADAIGKQLNKVHKPKPEWSILTLSIIFVSIGLIAMYYIEKQGLLAAATIPIFIKGVVFAFAGAVIAVVLYRFDYRKMEPYSRYIYLFTAIILAVLVIPGNRINGKLYLNIGVIYIDIAEIIPLMFSIALAGIFNKWVWNEPKKFLMGLSVCIAPLVLILASCPLPAVIIYSATCIILMAVSGAGTRRSLLLAGLLSRITALTIINAPPILKRPGFSATSEFMSGLHTDFIFSYISSTFGWIAGGVLAALVVMFIVRVACIAKAANNSYARLLISGFIGIFAVQFLWNILINLGFAPVSGVGLPFVSYGGSQLIVNAAALGMISSIYRRRNIARTFHRA